MRVGTTMRSSSPSKLLATEWIAPIIQRICVDKSSCRIDVLSEQGSDVRFRMPRAAPCLLGCEFLSGERRPKKTFSPPSSWYFGLEYQTLCSLLPFFVIPLQLRMNDCSHSSWFYTLTVPILVVHRLVELDCLPAVVQERNHQFHDLLIWQLGQLHLSRTLKLAGMCSV